MFTVARLFTGVMWLQIGTPVVGAMLTVARLFLRVRCGFKLERQLVLCSRWQDSFYGCDVTSNGNTRWCYVHGGKTLYGCDVTSNGNARWCCVHGGKTLYRCDVTSNWNARLVLCSRWQDSSRVRCDFSFFSAIQDGSVLGLSVVLVLFVLIEFYNFC